MFGMKKRAATGRLAGLLADYPPFAVPHRGRNGASDAPGPILSLDQAKENLAAYKAAIPVRLALLRPVLAALGIDMDRAYGDPLAFVTALHATLLAELPPLYRSDLASQAARDLSDRSGPHIALTFMADLAMLNADILGRAKPGCFVGLDLDPADRAMYRYRRPCLLGLVDRLFPDQPDIFDLEEEWFGYYANMDDPTRLAPPDIVIPATYVDVIGGMILQRLDREIVDPRLDDRLATSWMRDAA